MKKIYVLTSFLLFSFLFRYFKKSRNSVIELSSEERRLMARVVYAEAEASLSGKDELYSGRLIASVIINRFLDKSAYEFRNLNSIFQVINQPFAFECIEKNAAGEYINLRFRNTEKTDPPQWSWEAVEDALKQDFANKATLYFNPEAGIRKNWSALPTIQNNTKIPIPSNWKHGPDWNYSLLEVAVVDSKGNHLFLRYK